MTSSSSSSSSSSFVPSGLSVRSSSLSASSIWGVPLKYISLFLLIVQTVAVVLLLRYSRLSSSSSSPLYLNTTAVVSSEVVKLLTCCIILLFENHLSLQSTASQIHSDIFRKPQDTLKMAIPACLYTLQNNLIFIALSNLSGGVYQVTYQLKILTTAILSVIILRQRLSYTKWISLTILSFGVTLIQLPSDGSTFLEGMNQSSSSSSNNNNSSSEANNTYLGLIAVFSACCTSGFAGVYFEKILKQSSTSIWVRNMQLSIYGIFLGMIGAFWKDGEKIAESGFFQGYTFIVWVVVFFQAIGGIIVAIVLKYADNILKCFGNAMSICLSCLLSYYILNDFTPSIFFAVGVLLVVFATYFYGVDPAWPHVWKIFRILAILPREKRMKNNKEIVMATERDGGGGGKFRHLPYEGKIVDEEEMFEKSMEFKA